MNTFIIKRADDLYLIKEANQQYDEVTIHLNELKHRGLVRHAVKYTNRALKPKGRMIIYTSPFVSYHFRPNAIDFWQVKYEVFNCLKDAVNIIDVRPETGRIVLEKKKHLYNYSGVSFGIVFSGNSTEEQQLYNSINSIIESNGIKEIDYEIIISGPTDYDKGRILNNFQGINIRYVSIDISTSPRLMICEKKNLLYDSALYSIVVIIHTRILFDKNFVSGIVNSFVEMATPAVYFRQNDIQYKYLDLGFIDNYQNIQLGAKRKTIAGEYINKNYLHWYRNRVPYIDGGLNVFNKNIITKAPYNNYISWGEAEDIDLCNRLFQDGILIDYLPGLICFSATNKLKGYNNFRKMVRKGYVWLNHREVL